MNSIEIRLAEKARSAIHVWILLMLLTAGTWLVGYLELGGEWITLMLLGSVFIKGHGVIAEFMGLKRVSLLWRIILHGWLLVVIGVIFFTYTLGLKS